MTGSTAIQNAIDSASGAVDAIEALYQTGDTDYGSSHYFHDQLNIFEPPH